MNPLWLCHVKRSALLLAWSFECIRSCRTKESFESRTLGCKWSGTKLFGLAYCLSILYMVLSFQDLWANITSPLGIFCGSNRSTGKARQSPQSADQAFARLAFIFLVVHVGGGLVLTAFYYNFTAFEVYIMSLFWVPCPSLVAGYRASCKCCGKLWQCNEIPW